MNCLRLAIYLNPIIITEKEGKQSFSKVTSFKDQFPDYQKALPDHEKAIFDQLGIEYMRFYLLARQNAELSDYIAFQSNLSEKQIETVQKYYHSKLIELWPFLLQQKNLFMLSKGKALNASNIKPVQLSDSFPSFSFKVTSDEKFIIIQLIITIEGEKITQLKSSGRNSFFINSDHKRQCSCFCPNHSDIGRASIS